MIDTLAWSLLHFLWQGAAIAAVAGALMLAFRKPAARYLIGMSSLVAMVAAFGITFTLLSAPPGAGLPAAEAPAAVSASHPVATADFTPIAHSANVEPQAALFPDAATDFRWVAWLWLAGVCVFALRVFLGVLALEQLRRRSLSELPASLVDRFRRLAEQLGIRRAIRFCECRLVSVPAVIGLFRPIVLVPVQALTGLSAEQLEAVIAHELGHVRRLDVIANFFQVIAETLFFFHPAVWWLNKRIRADREECCDDIAVNAAGGSVGYAHALATMAGWRETPALALAVTGSPVAARVARLLGVHRRAGGRTAGVFTATLVLAGALMAGAVSLSLAKPAEAPELAVAEPTLVEDVVEIRDEQDLVDEAEVTTEETVVDEPVVVPESPANPPPPAPPVKLKNPPNAPPSQPAQPPQPAESAEPAPVAPPARPAKPVKTGSYLDDMKAAGITDLTADQLISLRVQDVTPEYIRQMRATGLDPNVDQIIAMRVHDVNPAYVQEVRKLGYKPDPDELIALKVHDVSVEYVKVMREVGIEPDVDQLIALKAQDVSPDYVRQMRSAGFTPDTDELIAMKVHDVTPELRREFEAAGFKLSIEELIMARAADMTPEFIAKVRAHGFKDLTFRKLVALKHADVL